MARKASTNIPQATELTPQQEDLVREDMAALDTVAQMRVSDALDVGIHLGRIQSAIFLRQCGEKIIAETFIQMRESKKYKELQFPDENGNLRNYGDLKEFCQRFLGKSYAACAESAQNYELLGSQLYEQAERMGLRQKDYRALRALPSDDQRLIQDALTDAPGREAVAELIEELTSRHAAKLAEAETKLKEATEQHEADERLLQIGNDKKNELERRLHYRESQDTEKKVAELSRIMTEVVNKTLAELDPLGKVFLEVRSLSDCPGHLVVAMEQALSRVVAMVQDLSMSYSVAFDLAGDDIPDFIPEGEDHGQVD
ncbi:MAG: hypothetical protein PHU46_12045 [Rhodocyclaceae bacterium]|nr:hypothetical protein [Rhodocyclaceae bacterium]